jgi:hypothetical protein
LHWGERTNNGQAMILWSEAKRVFDQYGVKKKKGSEAML